mgnify:CR=1 FL=1
MLCFAVTEAHWTQSTNRTQQKNLSQDQTWFPEYLTGITSRKTLLSTRAPTQVEQRRTRDSVSTSAKNSTDPKTRVRNVTFQSESTSFRNCKCGLHINPLSEQNKIKKLNVCETLEAAGELSQSSHDLMMIYNCRKTPGSDREQLAYKLEGIHD